MIAALFAGARLFAGNALGAVWRFLKHASFWQIVAIALAGLAIVQHFSLVGERRHSAKLQSQVEGLSVQLQRISSAQNEQKDRTANHVEKVVKGDPVVRTIVRNIQQAPNPPDCKTPGLETAKVAL